MRFKYWFYINEAISEKDKQDVLNSKLYTNEKDLSVKSKLDQLLSDLESDEKTYSKGEIFSKIQEVIPKIGVKKEREINIPINGNLKKYYDELIAKRITKNEYNVAELYQNEDAKKLDEIMEILRELINDKIIRLEFSSNKPVTIHRNEKPKTANNFEEFTNILHAVKSTESYKEGEDDFPNPWLIKKQHPDLLVDEVEKPKPILVFKANFHPEARLFGKIKDRESGWCVTWNNPSHFNGYRYDQYHTQYFIFDFNQTNAARYVNPGIGPDGRNSIWVDARNDHHGKTDPSDSTSEFAIEGFKSSDEYKNYLQNKGIDISIFKTDPPSILENDLKYILERKDFDYAKSYSDPKLLTLYLQMVDDISDENFDSLNAEEKKLFLMFRDPEDFTDHQLDYINKSVPEYLNSISSVTDKIYFLAKTENIDDLIKLINTKENVQLNDKRISIIMVNIHNKTKMAKYLVSMWGTRKINPIADISYILGHLPLEDRDEIIKTFLSKENINKYVSNGYYNALRFSVNKKEIAGLIGDEEMSVIRNVDEWIRQLFIDASNESEEALNTMVEILGLEKLKNLSDKYFMDIMHETSEKLEVFKQYMRFMSVEKLLKYTALPIRNFPIDNLEDVLKYIINNKEELTYEDVYFILFKSMRHYYYYGETKHSVDFVEITEMLRDYLKKMPWKYFELLLKDESHENEYISKEKSELVKKILNNCIANAKENLS